jgi:hypothetical protein
MEKRQLFHPLAERALFPYGYSFCCMIGQPLPSIPWNYTVPTDMLYVGMICVEMSSATQIDSHKFIG